MCVRVCVCLSLSPEDVAVAAGVVAAGFCVELVAAYVVFDHVTGGTLLDVDALVAAGGDAVASHDVVEAVVGPVPPLLFFFSLIEGRRQRRRG